MASTIAKDLLKEAAEKTAKEAAEKAAKEASEKALKEAAEKAAKEAAEKAAKEAAEKAAKEAAEKAAKQATEKAAKEAAEKAAKEAAEKAAKEAAAKTSMSAAKKAALAVGAGVAAYYVIDPALEAKEKNGSKYGITKIESVNNNAAKITYFPGQSIYIKDTLTLSNTNCVPPLVGNFKILSVDSDTQVTVITSQKIIKSGTTGTMVLNTNYENQLALQNQQIKENVDSVISTPEKIKDFFVKYLKIFIIGLIAIILLVLFLKFMPSFRKSSQQIPIVVRNMFGFAKKGRKKIR
jgi:cobalamin biosynthesis Mg chelatase CobN